MLIQVSYADNRYDYVKESRLDDLIASRKVVRFRRSTGWVTVGVDLIRGSKIGFFGHSGADRRAAKAGW
ncbi:MAG TPA: hypothetical protein VEM32_12240 [Geobacteraceae bacterium]|nr:hypothetical protein [Geobacteraceae bacterium]